MHTHRSGNIRFHHNGGWDGDVIVSNLETDEETRVPMADLLSFFDGYIRFRIEEEGDNERAGGKASLPQ